MDKFHHKVPNQISYTQLVVGLTQETRTHSTLTGTQQGARALDNGDERRGRRNGQYLGFLLSELAKDSTRSTRCN
jgi:hypothetical protein